MPTYRLNVDGAVRTIEAEKDEPLLYALTDALKFKGPKFGCGVGRLPIRRASLPRGRSPMRCVTSWQIKKRKCWACTWAL